MIHVYCHVHVLVGTTKLWNVQLVSRAAFNRLAGWTFEFPSSRLASEHGMTHWAWLLNTVRKRQKKKKRPGTNNTNHSLNTQWVEWGLRKVARISSDLSFPSCYIWALTCGWKRPNATCWVYSLSKPPVIRGSPSLQGKSAQGHMFPHTWPPCIWPPCCYSQVCLCASRRHILSEYILWSPAAHCLSTCTVCPFNNSDATLSISQLIFLSPKLCMHVLF